MANCSQQLETCPPTCNHHGHEYRGRYFMQFIAFDRIFNDLDFVSDEGRREEEKTCRSSRSFLRRGPAKTRVVIVSNGRDIPRNDITSSIRFRVWLIEVLDAHDFGVAIRLSGGARETLRLLRLVCESTGTRRSFPGSAPTKRQYLSTAMERYFSMLCVMTFAVESKSPANGAPLTTVSFLLNMHSGC